MSGPTKEQVAGLAALCSRQEWEQVLMCSHRFLAAAGQSIEAMEREASKLLGRRISLSKLSVSNPGDHTL